MAGRIADPGVSNETLVVVTTSLLLSPIPWRESAPSAPHSGFSLPFIEWSPEFFKS